MHAGALGEPALRVAEALERGAREQQGLARDVRRARGRDDDDRLGVRERRRNERELWIIRG